MKLGRIKLFNNNGLIVLSFLVITGCATIVMHQLDQLYGTANPARYDNPVPPVGGAPEYWKDVRPVLEQRCVVCHGCYDAPCQLKLTSWEGIARGASPDQVYGQRLLEAPMTRLGIDAQQPSQWRSKNFHPVLNERNNTTQANLQGSVFYRILELKKEHPLPQEVVLSDKDFDFSLNRAEQCTTIEEFDRFANDNPLWGMPYGLPAISQSQFNTLEKWLGAGAPAQKIPTPSAVEQKQIQRWETFFNGQSLKQQLMSRYIYEHLFLGHLYFNQLEKDHYGDRRFYRLVRSSTPPGTPIHEIPSRRPYDDPGVKFWYRLQYDDASIVEKTHMPYQLSDARMKKWQQWFIQTDYQVSELPTYQVEVASNPFIAFKDLPVKSRYQFLLDEAQFVVDNFIKGPVCRGQIALSVIDEHFWVFFVDPDAISVENLSDFLVQQSDHLYLPASEGSDGHLLDWLKYSAMQKKYLQAKAERIKDYFGANESEKMDLSLIWSGDENNPNAALTIFRHTDNATVVQGLVGQPPKTAWVLSYALLERIHYLLVAGFDIYGNVSHQVNTRLYMDFMRMEGESNFLMLLPEKNRASIRDFWYRDASHEVKDYLFERHSQYNVETSIHYQTANVQTELYGLLEQKLAPILEDQQYQLDAVRDAPLLTSLRQLDDVHGASLGWMAQNSIVQIGERYFTLINNLGYSNISELFDDAQRRRPQEDYLTVVPGVLGAYPNTFFKLKTEDLPEFVQRVQGLSSEADYQALMDRYGVRRTDERFWSFSDDLHHYIQSQNPVRGGILDYNRIENR